MPFIPHTEPDIAAMLASIGASDIDALFDEIPAELRSGKLTLVPEGMNEMQVARLMGELAAQDTPLLNFIGAGAYEHHIPAAVWQLATRGGSIQLCHQRADARRHTRTRAVQPVGSVVVPSVGRP